MPKEETLRTIEGDIKAGRLGLAKVRLSSLIVTYPEDLSLRRRLGDVCWDLGYYEEAGRFFYLCDGLEKKKKHSIGGFEKACEHKPHIILKRLRIRCVPWDHFDEYAQSRVRSLMDDCEEIGADVPNFKDDYRPRQLDAVPRKRKIKDALGSFGCMVVVVLFFMIFIAGIQSSWSQAVELYSR